MNGAPAAIGRRVAAYAIDIVLLWVIILVVGGILVGIALSTQGALPVPIASAATALVALGWFFAYTAMQAGEGSIGMRLLRLRLRRADGVAALGFGLALVRNLVWGVAASIAVGMFSPLFDRSPWHRGWHDLAAGALMTDIRVPGAAPMTAAAPEYGASPPGAPLPFGAPAPAGTPAPAPAGPPVPHLVGVPMPPPAAPTAPVPAPPAGTPVPGLPAPTGAPFPGQPAPQGAPAPVLPQPVSDEIADQTVIAPHAAPAHTPVPGAGAAPVLPQEVERTDAAPPPASASPAAGVIAFVPGITDPRSPRTAPASETVGPDAVPNDHTQLSTGPRAFATVVWDNGTHHSIYGRTLFGRNPAPETGAHTVAIRDETMSLSKTHFEIAGDDTGVWIIDRHSTNGVVVRRGAARTDVIAGERTPIAAGDILQFGDRSLTVELTR